MEPLLWGVGTTVVGGVLLTLVGPFACRFVLDMRREEDPLIRRKVLRGGIAASWVAALLAGLFMMAVVAGGK